MGTVYFNPGKETNIIVNVSPVGSGAMLTQEDRIICYTSRVLMEVEQFYSQTEWKMLAVIEHFHLYLFGSKFQITDHKPLSGIVKNQRPDTGCIERWRLWLMLYEYEIIYHPVQATENLADSYDRDPFQLPEGDNVAEVCIQYIVEMWSQKRSELQHSKMSYIKSS